MLIRIIWRSTIFLLTLLFIYLAFPIFIVPSSLPAIKAILLDEQTSPKVTDLITSPQTADAQIFELNIQTIKTPAQKLEALKKIHQQGINLILVKN
ncbi:MAG: hypothetical protein ABIJ43_05200 [Candidatus Beckwithbacteria bacterium]|nr:hypothetical protein [Patescibacteria group bacterium]